LLTPEDAHTFQIVTSTKFCIVDFTKSFFSKSVHRHKGKMGVSVFFKRLEYIFHNHQNVKGNIIADTDRNLFTVLIHQLIREKEKNQIFGEIILQNIVFLHLPLIARNIQEIMTTFSKK